MKHASKVELANDPAVPLQDDESQIHATNSAVTERPLIAHVICDLKVGGLENGVVNIVNGNAHQFRHVIICLGDYSDFRQRITNPAVQVYALNKRPGKDLRVYAKLWRLLRSLRPDIVHSRNYGTLDVVWVAAAAGVRRRVHGEHGWDMDDLHGTRTKYRWYRRAAAPWVQCFVPMSEHIASWLRDELRIGTAKIHRIYNGVDTARFQPRDSDVSPLPAGFADHASVVVGSVGRMQEVKGTLFLVQAFLSLWASSSDMRRRLRLLLVGDGPLHGQALAALQSAGAGDVVWLPGARDDVPDLLNAMDVFVLPSLNEGISNTVLEAMASSLPVVATRVGGNPELIEHGKTGFLVPPADARALADAIAHCIGDPHRMRRIGSNGRRRAESAFSMQAMLHGYTQLYTELLRVN